VPVPGLSHWDKPLGQPQPVPVGQADRYKHSLSQWDKHSLSQLGLGKVKRDLSLSHGTSHIPTLEAFPCPGTSSIPTMELVPVPLVPTCPTKWVYKAVDFSLRKWTKEDLSENKLQHVPYGLETCPKTKKPHYEGGLSLHFCVENPFCDVHVRRLHRETKKKGF